MDFQNTIENRLKLIFNSIGIYITDKNSHDRIVIDSLQLINLIIAIEEAFKINISDDFLELDKLITFDNYLALVVNKQLNNQIPN